MKKRRGGCPGGSPWVGHVVRAYLPGSGALLAENSVAVP